MRTEHTRIFTSAGVFWADPEEYEKLAAVLLGDEDRFVRIKAFGTEFMIHTECISMIAKWSEETFENFARLEKAVTALKEESEEPWKRSLRDQ